MTNENKLRGGEVWVDCAYAREVWAGLDKGARSALRDERPLAGPDARIRGGPRKTAFARVLGANAEAWAQVAGADSTRLILMGPPPIGDGDTAARSDSAEADEYLRGCRFRITTALERSTPLATHLCGESRGKVTAAQLTACAEDAAESLLASPREAFERLGEARLVFETPPRGDAAALSCLRAVVREIALLIYDADEIAGLQAIIAKGGAAALAVPAASATAAELVMARLDRRPAAFERAPDNEWPHGRAAIPLPADTGRDYFAQLGPAIERHIFSLTLSSAERALKDEALKLRLARIALKQRNTAIHGQFYCILNLTIAPQDQAVWARHVAELATRWPEIRFLDLKTDDPERYVLEKTLLWALKDFLFDD